MAWKDTLRNNVNTVEQLQHFIDITVDEAKDYDNIIEHFPLSSTTYYLDLIDPNDPEDPIRKMAIPTIDEFDISGDFDTSGESLNTKMKGLQHKYSTTALLLSTNKCAMYCRHCFRKRLVGTSNNETLGFINDAMDYIKEHTEINNVLITGGDSFLLENHLIESYLSALTEIDHIDFIRFGTRTPVVFPDRIYNDEELIGILNKYSSKKKIYVVTQFNHPVEITEEAMKAVNVLIENNIIVNNQTVLLKGVNDSPAILATLQNELVKKGIIPYYIFQCRPVRGVKNQFQMPLEESLQIVEDSKKMMHGHSKRIKFIMSHDSGKIEILGKFKGEMLFKYHQAKVPESAGKIFSVALEVNQAWLASSDIVLE